jgi:hypothetical protein
VSYPEEEPQRRAKCRFDFAHGPERRPKGAHLCRCSLLKSSWTQVDRLLDPKNDVTLSSLQRMVAMLGRRASIKLVYKCRELR